MVDLVMLSLLFEGPRYGYQLKKEAGIILGQPAVHNNTVYPLLRRFTARAWARKREVGGDRGQTRQLYTLTAAGRKELLRQLKTFSEKEAQREPAFQLRVSLFAALDAVSRERILAARERTVAAREERLAGIAKHFEVEIFAREVIAFRRRHIRAELAWLKRLRRLSKSSRGKVQANDPNN